VTSSRPVHGAKPDPASPVSGTIWLRLMREREGGGFPNELPYQSHRPLQPLPARLQRARQTRFTLLRSRLYPSIPSFSRPLARSLADTCFLLNRQPLPLDPATVQLFFSGPLVPGIPLAVPLDPSRFLSLQNWMLFLAQSSAFASSYLAP
jgi:hypothetical protein